VPGLYVAGDVDGGLPHSYLGGALVMGGLIGERASEYAENNSSAPDPEAIQAWIRKEMSDFEAPLRRDKGLPTHLVEYKARTRIQHYLKPPKNHRYLETAVWWMEHIRQEDLPQIKALDYHDLLKVYEIACILTVGEMMGRASLFREESRWGYQHWRVDLPAKKPEWEGRWVVISKENSGKMRCTDRQCPPLKWEYPTSMEYQYPKLEFDVGTPFKKGPDWKNPESDGWMETHLKEEGMKTPRRFMPQED
jgi:succinate dehydrogenase/fumarate reductase flavoprotein subunit